MTAEDGGETGSMVDGLRRQAFTLTPDQVGIDPSGEPAGVWGVVFELGIATGAATVIALADGTTSLYVTGGFGIIGGGAHDAVIAANRRLRGAVADKIDAFRPDAGMEQPATDDVRVRALTVGGRLVADAAQSDLVDGSHPLSDLFFAGHGVITELRQIHEASGA